MASRKFDNLENEAAEKIYKYLVPKGYQKLSDNSIFLSPIWIANTIAGTKPLSSIPESADDIIPRILDRIKDAVKINKKLVIKSVKSLGKTNILAIGTPDRIKMLKKALAFGRGVEEYYGCNINETPSGPVYHIFMGRAFGYSDNEISEFIGQDIQTALKDFKSILERKS